MILTRHVNTPEVAKAAGAKGAARLRAKHRRELMREVIDAHREGTVKSLEELVIAFAREAVSELD